MKKSKTQREIFLENHRIIVDTREKIPFFTNSLWCRGVLLKPNIIKEKLDNGDYSIEGYSEDIAIERKSRTDFWNSITYERKRFEREIKRLSNYKVKAVVIEGTFDSIISAELYGRHITPDSISGTVASWWIKYNIPFYFLLGRKEAETFTLQLLFHGVKFLEECKTLCQ